MLDEEHIDCERETQTIRKRVREQGEKEKAVRIPHCAFMRITPALIPLFIFILSFGVTIFAPSFQWRSAATKQSALEAAATEERSSTGTESCLQGSPRLLPHLLINPKSMSGSDFGSPLTPRNTSRVPQWNFEKRSSQED